MIAEAHNQNERWTIFVFVRKRTSDGGSDVNIRPSHFGGVWVARHHLETRLFQSELRLPLGETHR